jgi:hypothetical protein
MPDTEACRAREVRYQMANARCRMREVQHRMHKVRYRSRDVFYFWRD